MSLVKMGDCFAGQCRNGVFTAWQVPDFIELTDEAVEMFMRGSAFELDHNPDDGLMFSLIFENGTARYKTVDPRHPENGYTLGGLLMDWKPSV